MDPSPRRRLGRRRSTERLSPQQLLGRLVEIGDRRAGLGRVPQELRHRRRAERAVALGECAAAAQRVGFVEEHDHAVVAQGELAQLAEQRLDLDDPDAHEHVDERAGIDEHERLAGLTGGSLGEQRLAGARWPPQQDPTRGVAAAGLDRVGVLEEDQVLADLVPHRILAPHVFEPGVDVVGEIGLDPTAGEEPEQEGELADHQQRIDDQPSGERQGIVHPPRERDQRFDRGLVVELADDNGDDHQPEHHPPEPRQAVTRPGVQSAAAMLRPAEHALLPEPVVAGGALGDQVVDLTDELGDEQHEDPGLTLDGVPERVGGALDRVVVDLLPPEEDEQPSEQEQVLRAVPQRQRSPGRAVCLARS